ncbi:MAG: hypothetical protein EOO77_43460 [Oxalobacteraceae bacterium]|nr:MAG: hypothetical protein EOO77_43460 [Oxalobacteraceae bacterium]
MKRYSKGYQYLYKNVEQQIRVQMMRNPILQQTSVTVPQYAHANIVIPMKEGVKYVCTKLQKNGIHVLRNDGDRLLVSWASLTALPTSSYLPRHHPTVPLSTLIGCKKKPDVIDVSSSESSSS